MIASGFLYQTFVATKMLPTQWPSQNIQITVIRPSCWKWLPALSVTAVLASSLSLVGWLHTLMMTLMSPPVQSWHSTKICSAVPTRNKLGADITFLQRWEEERVTITLCGHTHSKVQISACCVSPSLQNKVSLNGPSRLPENHDGVKDKSRRGLIQSCIDPDFMGS